MTTCALVATCDFNAEHFKTLDALGAFDYVIAADAGYAHLQGIDRVPNAVVGDFDSLGYVPDFPDVEVHPTHKDESDFELALNQLVAQQANEVFVYGAIGGRLDHTMANLQTAAGFAEQGMDITFVAMDCCIKILAGPGRYELPCKGEGTVSVFSASDHSYGVTESGMEYTLDNAELTNRTTRGLSNELIGKQAVVSVSEGTLYIFHPIEYARV